MVQTTLTGFLSPPPGGTGGQSPSTPPPRQASPVAQVGSQECRNETRAAPQRKAKKSKKVQRTGKKEKRKRAKLNRQTKKDSCIKDPGTHVTSDKTPVKSNRSNTRCDNDNHANCSFLDNDKSLTDMLASESNIDRQSTYTESADDLVLRLEAQAVAADIEIQGLHDERSALQNQVEL